MEWIATSGIVPITLATLVLLASLEMAMTGRRHSSRAVTFLGIPVILGVALFIAALTYRIAGILS